MVGMYLSKRSLYVRAHTIWIISFYYQTQKFIDDYWDLFSIRQISTNSDSSAIFYETQNKDPFSFEERGSLRQTLTTFDKHLHPSTMIKSYPDSIKFWF